jgi:hypothetical protein
MCKYDANASQYTQKEQHLQACPEQCYQEKEGSRDVK